MTTPSNNFGPYIEKLTGSVDAREGNRFEVFAPVGCRFIGGPHSEVCKSTKEANEAANLRNFEPCPEDCDCGEGGTSVRDAYLKTDALPSKAGQRVVRILGAGDGLMVGTVLRVVSQRSGFYSVRVVWADGQHSTLDSTALRVLRLREKKAPTFDERAVARCAEAAKRTAPDANLDECRAALLVFVLSPATEAWLAEHDPMALAQARRALRLPEAP